MTDEFYSYEACEELWCALYNAVDSLKYVYSSHSSGLDNEGAKFFKDKELLEAYRQLRNVCFEFIHTYDFYDYTHKEVFPKDKDFAEELRKRVNDYKAFLSSNFETIVKYPVESEDE